ncbi:MAG: dolichyl-phosphate beta-D-mannosyltransferase, partial [Flavobacteriaceae bacterium]|nr:dolichyl-phosphate beta-D-mannosyltransferase [Flavobacteriaceae bacterium]
MTSSPYSHLVVIPTYNEIDNIPDFVSEISKFNVSVLFVDDNSPDGTGELLSKISKSNPKIKILNRASKQGLGSAYRDGFGWGIEKGYEFFIEMDADFSHRFDDLKNILEVSTNFDLIIGSRYVS